MVRLTCRKYQGKAVTKENTSRNSNAPKRTPKLNVHVAKAAAKEKKPVGTKYVSEDEDDEADSTIVPISVRDISLDTYTLHKSVVVGDTAIVSDTDFLKFEEFDFRDFEMQNIHRLNDAATKGGFEFEYVSGIATLSAKGVRVMDNIVITVEDNGSWKKVEKGIERWMHANKKEITVKVAIVYAKTMAPDSDSSENQKPARKKVVVIFLVLILGTENTYYKTASEA